MYTFLPPFNIQVTCRRRNIYDIILQVIMPFDVPFIHEIKKASTLKKRKKEKENTSQLFPCYQQQQKNPKMFPSLKLKQTSYVCLFNDSLLYQLYLSSYTSERAPLSSLISNQNFRQTFINIKISKNKLNCTYNVKYFSLLYTHTVCTLIPL